MRAGKRLLEAEPSSPVYIRERHISLAILRDRLAVELDGTTMIRKNMEVEGVSFWTSCILINTNIKNRILAS